MTHTIDFTFTLLHVMTASELKLYLLNIIPSPERILEGKGRIDPLGTAFKRKRVSSYFNGI